jgi:hypothetical protein
MPVPTSPVQQERRAIYVLGALTLLWFVTYFFARAFLENPGPSTAVRVAVALLPIPFFAGALWKFIAFLRAADEFERRIHLEALAVAFPLTMLLLMILALMQRAVTLKFEDWSYAHVWYYLPIFYLGGLALARRRYQ